VTNTMAARELTFETLKGLVLTPVTAGLNIAVMGPPGVGKTTFCQSLLGEASRTGFRCLYAVTNSPLQLTRDQLRIMGIPPPGRPDQVTYVDMYSWLLGERSTERFQIENGSDMAAASVALSGAAETIGDRAFIAFDSVSTLLAYNTEELIVRFLKSHLARMKKHGNIGAYAFETGIHSPSFYNEVKASFDSVIEMKLEELDGELRRFVRVYSYRGAHETKWFSFLITPEREVKIY
jgi:KaiC/GvpD/RAD55 family RecA-like ATPase